MKKFIFLLVFLLSWSPSTAVENMDESYVKPEQFSRRDFLLSVERCEKWVSEFGDILALFRRYSGPIKLYTGFRYRYPKDLVLTFKVPADSLSIARYKLLSWEYRNLDVPNNLIHIKGFSLMNQTELLRLKLENMEIKGAPVDSIDTMRSEYQEAKKEWEWFLKTTRWRD